MTTLFEIGILLILVSLEIRHLRIKKELRQLNNRIDGLLELIDN